MSMVVSRPSTFEMQVRRGRAPEMAPLWCTDATVAFRPAKQRVWKHLVMAGTLGYQGDATSRGEQMRARNLARFGTVVCVILALSACGDRNPNRGGVIGSNAATDLQTDGPTRESRSNLPLEKQRGRSSFFDLFNNNDDPNVTLEVNKYIWNATLDVLDFMPVQSADPFSGVLVFGFGTPPGSGRAYRATVFVQDPALDARSLRVALATRSGPAPTETVRAIEDAILTRARQLRVSDERL